MTVKDLMQKAENKNLCYALTTLMGYVDLTPDLVQKLLSNEDNTFSAHAGVPGVVISVSGEEILQQEICDMYQRDHTIFALTG